MFGPGQFLGNVKINLNQNDVWSNDISDKAIKARQVEDQAEAATWTTRKAELQALMQNRAGATAEEKAEYQVGLAREAARNERAAQRLCWCITKNGAGTLTLTGNNSFTGAITVNEGQLSGLNQSLGSAQQVIVKQGATLEVLHRKRKSLNQVIEWICHRNLNQHRENGYCNSGKRWSFLTE